jgi:hypothetical protein
MLGLILITYYSGSSFFNFTDDSLLVESYRYQAIFGQEFSQTNISRHEF